MDNPTTEEYQVILSALQLANPESPLGETLISSAVDIVKSYMGDSTIVEVEYNDGPITIRGFGIPKELLEE